MGGQGVTRCMGWVAMIAAVMMAFGCSKATDPNDPSSQYDDTDWVFERKGIELHLEDGQATMVNHQADKTASLTYTVDPSGNVTLEGEEVGGRLTLMRTPGGGLENQVLDLYFKLKAEGDDARMAAQASSQDAARSLRESSRPASPEGYRLLQGDDFKYLFASRMPELTDEMLAKAFIEGYASESDAFKKQELMQSQMPAVRARLAQMAQLTDFRFNTVTERNLAEWNTAWAADVDGGPLIGAVNPNTQAFPFSQNLSGCSHDEPGMTSTHIGGSLPSGGVTYVFRRWGSKNDPICQIKVEDLNVARRIEEARSRSNLAVRTTVYARMTGEKMGGHWVLDVHRVDVQFFVQGPYDHQARHWIFEQVPGTYTLTDQ